MNQGKKTDSLISSLREETRQKLLAIGVVFDAQLASLPADQLAALNLDADELERIRQAIPRLGGPGMPPSEVQRLCGVPLDQEDTAPDKPSADGEEDNEEGQT